MSEVRIAEAPEEEAGPPDDDPGGAYCADPYDYADARALMDSLELAEPVAITLVRRGHRTPEQAREFLAADVGYAPEEFEGIGDAVAAIRSAIAAASLITVHGDYDVDGISSTAILIATLRRAGARCDWLIPDRAADGYGLSGGTIERLAGRGTGLLITADCGITSAEEIDAAAAAGIEAVVTDHHRPGDRLPDCPIVHPEVSGYPFGGLCGAAVAYKLACALGDPEALAGRELDLVALATIADLVPLVDENRTLARRGIAELRKARRPGIRALLATSKVEPEHLDEGDIAFRIGPRLNAAGRLYRADAGVELMLTDDQGRAQAIAGELDSANHERRRVERELSSAAAAAYRDLGDNGKAAAGIVLWGEDWHPGVVGIAASRMVDRLQRPVILLSLDAGGRARGSGRSVPGFDLLAALKECSDCLDRFGGHRAAAGMELSADSLEAFRKRFEAAAHAQRPAGTSRQPERIDAVVGAEALDIEVAEQLGGLGPFGQGNPAVRLLLPWAQVDNVKPMGEEGRHARFSVRSGGATAGAVAFNANRALAAARDSPHDLTVRLELNHWNGAVEPRAVLDRTRDGGDAPANRCACSAGADEEWWSRFDAELDADPGAGPTPGIDLPGAASRDVIEHPRRSAVALISELLSSGAGVLVVCADARRRAGLAAPAASPGRFGGSHAIVCGSCPEGELTAAAERGVSLLLTDWEALAAAPATALGFAHVVAVDPPPSPADEALVGYGEGYSHHIWTAAGDLPELCWAERWRPRTALAEIYRGAVVEPSSGSALGQLLCGGGTLRRGAAVAARCIRVLEELGIVRISGKAGDRMLRVVSSERTELQRSSSWRAYTARYEEGLLYMQNRQAS